MRRAASAPWWSESMTTDAALAASPGSPLAAADLLDGISMTLADESVELTARGHESAAERLVYLVADVLDTADELRGVDG